MFALNAESGSRIGEIDQAVPVPVAFGNQKFGVVPFG